MMKTYMNEYEKDGQLVVNMTTKTDRDATVDVQLAARVLKLEHDLTVAERKVQELEAVLDRIAVEATEATREP